MITGICRIPAEQLREYAAFRRTAVRRYVSGYFAEAVFFVLTVRIMLS